MGTCHIRGLLFLFLLGASASALAQQYLYCHKGVSVNIEEDPTNAFNWTTEKVETCDNGTVCQETALMIKAGTKTAVLVTKGCISGEMQILTFVQHTPPPGLVAVSYSSYCDDSFCNDKNSLFQFWNREETSVSTEPTTLQCPTCVALGNCSSAPSLPCPRGTTRCYEGKLEITGGGIESSVGVKGCTAMRDCKLMASVSTVGPMLVKEICPKQLLTEPRKAENGATYLPISVWRLQLLLPLLLQLFVHFS
ncbi:PREDICTED: testis-expressed sequence 101 protein [Propithecus coquereli]|nr:PREDICTED: testis-expressed sequence 101 protein [Propithecus coquereli]